MIDECDFFEKHLKVFEIFLECLAILGICPYLESIEISIDFFLIDLLLIDILCDETDERGKSEIITLEFFIIEFDFYLRSILSAYDDFIDS